MASGLIHFCAAVRRRFWSRSDRAPGCGPGEPHYRCVSIHKAGARIARAHPAGTGRLLVSAFTVAPALIVASALLLPHSIARNHALIDGNKRLALAAVIAFYGLNGRRLTLTNNESYDLIISVAAGQLDNVDEIAAVLQGATQSRR